MTQSSRTPRKPFFLGSATRKRLKNHVCDDPLCKISID
jgi:hypothetical protein